MARSAQGPSARGVMWSLLGSTVATGAGLLGGNLAFGRSEVSKRARGHLGRSNLLLPFTFEQGTAVAVGAYKPVALTERHSVP